MLSSETKKKIDNARDTLVGKIPVPMSQIEQITLAMTYKFMSDIDEENKELGGNSFFEGDFEKYAWKNLMDKRLGAQERMNLYSEGLDSMPKNKNIPELFRDIFRNAYLPFKDPQTLDRFLKQINEFSYDHSEELGNAFEYLLSTAGSQGDAGQFRTPRHIIDFLVSIVEPTKEDTILDPACGTAGFLISAYKYILAQNADKNGKVENKLELIKTLSKNINGYDISHDMVRLSLVNMYLHNFGDPKIHEYDTLSSEDRWGEDYSCILANPPFMSPKGGIQPHSRFSIKASKSEVLFVDYIMEHLTINGKAGIIVPEGIIFQSANAYKELRKNMIENNYLWAVVSLPSGIFQPYSGVKTSILLFDKNIAKKTDKIIFLKVEQDGYDLGAQRREIQKNDLPKALELLLEYKKSILKENDFVNTDKNVLIVENEIIKGTGDYNLSAERYRENTSLQNSDFDMVELGEVLEYEQPTNYIVDSVYYDDTYKIPVLTAGKTFILGYTNEEKGVYPKEKLPVIIFDDFTTAIKFVDFPFKVKSSAMKILNPVLNKANPIYLFYIMQKISFPFTEHKRYWISQYSKIKIPLPTLEIQEQIVAELDNYQKIIDGAKLVVQNYKPKIKIDDSWEVVDLGDVCDLYNGYAFKSTDYIDEKTNTLNIRMSNIRPNNKFDSDYSPKYLPDNFAIKYNNYLLNDGDLIIAMTDMAGEPKILGVPTLIHSKGNRNFLLNQRVGKLIDIDNSKINIKFLSLILGSDKIKEYYKNLGGGGVQINIGKKDILSAKIPLPPLEIQEKIVAKTEEEQKLVDSSKKLIEIFEGKIKDRISEIWGEKCNLDGNL
ncbi:MAG: N-6 DNA methylase [Candidatus Gracilibacteria bacterium]|nr:N-6 DNA methylase [Candidatus Gracilibacteria bacterium]